MPATLTLARRVGRGARGAREHHVRLQRRRSRHPPLDPVPLPLERQVRPGDRARDGRGEQPDGPGPAPADAGGRATGPAYRRPGPADPRYAHLRARLHRRWGPERSRRPRRAGLERRRGRVEDQHRGGEAQRLSPIPAGRAVLPRPGRQRRVVRDGHARRDGLRRWPGNGRLRPGAAARVRGHDRLRGPAAGIGGGRAAGARRTVELGAGVLGDAAERRARHRAARPRRLRRDAAGGPGTGRGTVLGGRRCPGGLARRPGRCGPARWGLSSTSVPTWSTSRPPSWTWRFVGTSASRSSAPTWSSGATGDWSGWRTHPTISPRSSGHCSTSSSESASWDGARSSGSASYRTRSPTRWTRCAGLSRPRWSDGDGSATDRARSDCSGT